MLRWRWKENGSVRWWRHWD